jgi:hypothetical protein
MVGFNSRHFSRTAFSTSTPNVDHAGAILSIPMPTGRLRLDNGMSETFAELVVGQSYARNAPVEHNVVNANPYELASIEIELKR